MLVKVKCEACGNEDLKFREGFEGFYCSKCDELCEVYIENVKGDRKMKFYEFNNFGYYALIGACTMQRALEKYKNVIVDFEEEGFKPDEITFKEASDRYCKCLLEQGEENKTYEEFEEDFKKFSQSEEVCIFLIDGGLL